MLAVEDASVCELLYNVVDDMFPGHSLTLNDNDHMINNTFMNYLLWTLLSTSDSV